MRQNTVVSQQPLSRVLGSKTRTATGRPALSQRPTIVRGREAVSALQPALVALSRATGQAGAMDWLSHHLHSPSSLKKDPHVVLFGRDAGASPDRIDEDWLLGAVLIYEYRFAGLPTGIFATDDVSGTRTVIASASSRFELAQRATAQLMRRNAAIVFASVDQEAAAPEPPVLAGARFAHRTRWIPTSLALSDTIESTLAQFGTRTRRNLRYYRRRAVTELGAQFIPHAQLSQQEFLALNRTSTHPLSQQDALWRHGLFEESSMSAATLYAGMRSTGGGWLSLIWGHRRGGVTEVEWQINRAADSHHSFSIAMRAFLLEHEVVLGTQELRFVGGTQHSIRASCTDRPVTDVLAVRPGSIRGWALRRFAQRLLPDANFLRGALEDEEMVRVAPRTRSEAWAGLRIF